VIWKVRLLCAAWPESAPKQGEVRTAPEVIAAAKDAGFDLEPLDGGGFLSSIYDNWTDKKPNTTLKDAEKVLIEAMPWFRVWRGGVYGPVIWKVRLLCAAWPESVPKWGDVRASPEVMVAAKDAGFDLNPLDGGGFLNSIYDNWTDKKPSTTLKDAEKALIEAMPWFRAWRGGLYGTVIWKVWLLCAAWPESVPKHGEVRAAPEVMAMANDAGFDLNPLDGGRFLSSIYDNWTDKKPSTTLKDAEKALIEAMPWFRVWRCGIYGTLIWKVRLLGAAWPESVPKQGEVRTAPEVIAVAKDAGFDLEPLDGGVFLQSIYHNWTDKKPNTTLKDAEKALIEAMPWFRVWRRGKQGPVIWKVRLLCAAWPESVPKRGEVRTAPEVIAAAKDAGFDVEPLDGGRFFSRIRDNWTDKKPNTTLKEAEKALIEALPWFSVWMDLRKRKRDSDDGRSVKSRIDSDQSESIPQPLLALSSSSSEHPAPASARGYDAASFTVEHLTFKDECTAIFVRYVLDFCNANCGVAYLDDFDGTPSKDLRTTKALLNAGVSPDRLYMANPNGLVVHKMKRYSTHVHAAYCTFEVALSEKWRSDRFGALYLDLCTGSSEVVLANLEAAMPALERRCALGFTFTRRDGVGESAMERQFKIDGFLREHGFERSCHDGLQVFTSAGVYTQFYSRC